jgi:hypothetical protein
LLSLIFEKIKKFAKSFDEDHPRLNMYFKELKLFKKNKKGRTFP